MGRLLTLEEVAGRLALSPLTVRRLVNQGRLPALRPTPSGRAVRVAEVDLERYLAELREAAGAEG